MFQRFISFATTAALILATLPVIVPSPAQARFPHGSASTCVYAIDNGCAAAAGNGSFKNASLLTSAQQSGQNSLLPSRAGGLLTLNIPGVDYGIGPDSTLTPRDPRTISDGVCVYQGTPPADFVGCAPPVNGQVVTDTINNYDFCGTKIGKSSIPLYLGGSPGLGSSVTATNNYFCIQATDPVGVATFGWGDGNWSFIYKNNQCDGSNATLSSDFCMRGGSDTNGTTADIEYNAFTNQNVGRVMGGGHYITTTFKYNFVQGLNDLQDDGTHGEIELRSCSVGGCTTSVDYESNFIIWNARNNASTTQTNSTFFPSTGSSNGLVLTSMTIKNNVIVTNTQGTPPTPTGFHIMGQALFGQRAASLGVVTITGNWMDATGATGCGVSGVTSGGDSVTASTSGNIITVTSTSSGFNNNPIEPGWQIFHSGFTTANITAYGTGGGKLGTYTFDGPPQSLGSDSNWTIVPGFTSATLSNNWNLADPSSVGTPTAVGFTGPTMRETTCLTLAN